MLRVAILSGWHVHAHGYAKEFASIPGVRLTAMYDEDAARGEKFAKEFGMDFVPCLDGLLARDDVDAVCVNTPTNTHGEVMVKAANAKKHIFTEKVLAITMEEALRIKDAVLSNGVKFCISFPHRCAPHNLYAKKVLEERILGDITLMRVRNAHNGSARGWLPPHFYDPVQCGGGAMMDLGAHPMYLINWLMGMPVEISSIFTAVTKHEVEDNAVSVMRFKDGAIAISETGFVSENSPFALELYGNEGSLIIGQNGVYLNGTKIENDDLPKPLPGPIVQFVNGITEGGEIIFGIDAAVALTQLMEAAYKSHKAGNHVTIKNIE